MVTDNGCGKADLVLDVRAMLAGGQEPFDAIMQGVAALEEGQDLVVIAPFEPVPLEGVLSGQGFTYQVTEFSPEHFSVTFHRD
ncbi:DUF2249 domain-containing protein [Acidithrix ferrooxidans]|uniref:DUF2249 domain-containing protein n=1 Tax=Acidithrix ferrooxidans TaxID=1280514 RepID=A0A0D8HFS1_9ACTN|nr:DUF2249 domain-containing protein [Acidithrix ferrooxidans]KJF16642.1 hypothetical protein AXFE_25050 [Acidithrix ferrooxidans]